MDRVIAPAALAGERLHDARQARHADPQPGVEGHVDLGHRRQAPVDLGVGAEDLDLEARHAALADLLDRARDPVRRADAVGEDRHARALAVSRRARARRRAVPAARVESNGIAASFVCSLARNALAGAYGIAATHASNRPPAAASAPLAGGRGRHRRSDRLAQLALVRAAGSPVEVAVAEVLVLHVGDQAALVEVRRARPRSSHARSRQRASSGFRSPPISPVANVALAQQPPRHRQHPQRIGPPRRRGRDRRRRASARPARSRRAPTWPRCPGRRARATSPARTRARNSAGVRARGTSL